MQLTFKKNFHVVSFEQICQDIVHEMSWRAQSEIHPGSETIDPGP